MTGDDTVVSFNQLFKQKLNDPEFKKYQEERRQADKILDQKMAKITVQSDDLRIFHEYLMSAGEAQVNHDKAKRQRLVNKLCQMYSNQDTQTDKLIKDVNDYLDLAVEEYLDELGSWYMLDNDALTLQIKQWVINYQLDLKER